MKALFRFVVALAALAGLLAAAAAYSIVRRGPGTQVEPSRVETLLAGTMRRLAVPSELRDAQNPVPASDEVLDEGLAHFAEHCAICHANDGSGDTDIGRRLYPKAPDMRGEATQSLSDGELFAIIEHGVRLTGMPGWSTGTPEGERESWALVHFVRRLPSLSGSEIDRMEALNPRTPAQLREEEEIRRFLAGEEPLPPVSAPAHEGEHR
jgi:mono/diheme cytochrome c family protein